MHDQADVGVYLVDHRRVRGVGLHELEALVREERLYVGDVPHGKVVEADDRMTLRKQPLEQIRAEKAGDPDYGDRALRHHEPVRESDVELALSAWTREDAR